MIRLDGLSLRYSAKGMQKSALETFWQRVKPGQNASPSPKIHLPEVLSDINLHIDKGSFTYLTGVSGAGKSTLLKLIYLRLQPTGGTLRMFGKNVAALSSAERARLRRQIGVVFQDYRLIDHLTVEENVALPLRIAADYNAHRRADILDLLTWVGLGDALDAYPPTLSGGQKQRVALARAVITRPKLLLADEPTGNLDGGMGARLIFLLEELNRLGTSIMVATHSTPLVARFPHPVFHLQAGRGRSLSAGEFLAHYSDDALIDALDAQATEKRV